MIGKLVVGVAVAAVVLVVGDTAAHQVVESRVASQVATDVSAQSASVSLDGSPFLLHLAEGTYPTASLHADHLQLDGVPLDTLDATGTQLDVPPSALLGGSGALTVGTVSATGVVGYSELANLVKEKTGLTATVGYVSPGVIRISTDVPVLGSVGVDAAVHYEGDTVKVALAQASLDALPALVRRLVPQSFELAVPALPQGLTIARVSVGRAGLEVTATGKNVELAP